MSTNPMGLSEVAMQSESKRRWKKSLAGRISKKRCAARYRKTPHGRAVHLKASAKWRAKRRLLRDAARDAELRAIA